METYNSNTVRLAVLADLKANNIKFEELIVSDISKNIVITIEIKIGEKFTDFKPRLLDVIKVIKNLPELPYGLYLNIENPFAYTLATMSFNNPELHLIDCDDNEVNLQVYSVHYSVPTGLR